MRREQRTTTKSNPIAGRPSPCSSPRTVATTTRADSLDEDAFDYIERFYNPRRRHSTLGYLTRWNTKSKLT
jgi:putative transposase